MTIPAALQKGDTVGIVCLANKIALQDIQPGIKLLESWGLRVVLGESVGAEYNQMGGSDEVRTADFQRMLDDPEIKAVISARGGYGTTRILDQIDFAGFYTQPKWVVGFSDVTALLCHLHRMGIECLHATMPKLMAQPDTQEADESLRRALFGETLSYSIPSHTYNQIGIAQGLVVGGNLILLDTIVNTPSDIDYDGKILFLEDVGEYYYNIDRVLVHMRRMGRLRNLAGLIIGQFTEMKDNQIPFGKTVNEIVLEHCAGYGYPICFDFPVGHVPHNLAMVVGREAKLKVDVKEVTLEYLKF
ncbi:S66 peptidase family protein [Rufibacter roseus]|uniref:LD-carboxypeptidase n=1 Tax=Rufibacter roseus TaxID=1567108 RepID=A0ABW2DGZ7_9BACT|nr:LD-carboxypeptidase [Rufibacter roseus]